LLQKNFSEKQTRVGPVNSKKVTL